MDLTTDNKVYIDGLSLFNLLKKWRFSPVTDEWLKGETKEYWSKRLSMLRANNPSEYVRISKLIGW